MKIYIPKDSFVSNSSTFNPTPDGAMQRRLDLFRACNLIVMEDVGQKLALPMFLVALGAPSYRIEMSPGWEQWGYLMSPPETRAPNVNAMLKGLIAHGLPPRVVDPGKMGVLRMARLPAGLSTEAAHDFAH